MIVRNELFNIIRDNLPDGLHNPDETDNNIKNEIIGENNTMECGIFFGAHRNPVMTLDKFRPEQESFRLQLLVNSGTSKELLSSTKQWCEDARYELMGLHNYIRYWLDDNATEEMKNITIPSGFRGNAKDYIVSIISNLGYKGSFEYLYIDRIEPLGNVIKLDRNEQGITRFSINFLIYYTYNKEV